MRRRAWRAQRRADVTTDINPADPISRALERVGAGFAPTQRHFALSRPAPIKTATCFIASAFPPTRLISHSRSIPEFSLTFSRTVSPKVSISAALALPRLIRKLL